MWIGRGILRGALLGSWRGMLLRTDRVWGYTGLSDDRGKVTVMVVP